MKIKALEIKGLFGRFDYEFKFDNKSSNLFMFHGYNGAGKTKVLSIIDRLSRRDFTNLSSLNCDFVKMTYQDDRSLIIQRQSRTSKHKDSILDFENEILEKASYDVFLEENGKRFNLLNKKPNDKFRNKIIHTSHVGAPSLNNIDKLIPHLVRIDRDVWQDERTSVTMSLPQIIHSYSEWLPEEYLGMLVERYNLEIFQVDKLPIIKTRFINTRRLDYANLQPKSQRTIREAEEVRNPLNDLSKKISDKLARSSSLYAAKSQQLDSLFPRTILGGEEKKYEPAEVSLKLENLKAKAEALYHAGILEQPDTIDLETSSLDPLLLGILARYCEDTEEKLNVFEDIYERISLLTQIINKRFRFKNISISKNGIVVFDETQKLTLALESLSSGEQHELFLFADLIFSDDLADLIFIDEPEISLHVEWQESFVDDLLRINSLQKSQIFIATHSPSIIGHHWDKSFDLAEQNSRHD